MGIEVCWVVCGSQEAPWSFEFRRDPLFMKGRKKQVEANAFAEFYEYAHVSFYEKDIELFSLKVLIFPISSFIFRSFGFGFGFVGLFLATEGTPLPL